MEQNLSFEQAKQRIEKLKRAINKYRYAYHVLNKSLISDSALDSLKKELFVLEQIYPKLITPDSPTQRIGGKPLEQFKKISHIKPMLSFNDAFSESDMRDWIERLENYLGKKVKPEFYCELKIDGLAIEFVYENGILTQGQTRGDGLIGEDVTENLKTIDAIPLNLKNNEQEFQVPKKLVVRGEVFLTKKEFERINKEQEKKGEKIYANPRNIAAGSVRQLDSKITASRKLDSFAYDIVAGIGETEHEREHKILKQLGFKTNPHNKFVKSLKEVFVFRDYWEKHRGKLEYEIDGIVVILNDNKIFNDAGVIGKAPRAAIAYKFSPKEATTKVKDIRIQVGRTGILTPVADLLPVELGGVTITHATLHNYDEIKRLDVKIGDTVVVLRAGDVIPKITAVVKKLRTGKEKDFMMPVNCPNDGSKVVREGALYKCSNQQCGARERELLYHFVSRQAFDIRGLGQKIIDRFLDEGLISDAADIFTLKNRQDDIASLERFGEKSARNIIEEVESKKRISLPRFIYSLGILHIGEETAALLARNFQFPISNNQIKISGIIKVFQNTTLEGLQKIQDIGPKVAQSIYNWFHNERNIRFLEKLDKVGVEIEISNFLKGRASGFSQFPISNKFTGKTFVFTGGLETISRDEAKEKVRVLGGDVSESVSKKTDYVVYGKEPGSKYDKAKKLGIKIINEKEFLEMIK